ncbi:heparinase II/III family protein [Dokdonella sp.]|uniref:heparinase II/III domain-containing protein n=1 Tax=Dokdonella sp. TaxID=2291710 RepID=UPI001B015FF8|nr:heparinase II/III family protein [Dokdonella sp.]MBO9662543.1 hypothetical protein [Dokdonella sp.]
MLRSVPRFALAALLAAGASPPCYAAIDLDLSYVDLQSPAYWRFEAWVDQAVAGAPGYAFSATDAAYLFRLTGRAPYAALAVQMVERQVADAEALIAQGERPEISGDSYLHVGEMLRDLALTYDWCAASITPQQRTRWSAYAEQAVWNVWHPAEAHWGGHAHPWSGWSIDNPANNYYYSFVEATMVWALATDDASQRATWMQWLQGVKLPALEQYAATLSGGGSQEGTGYGLSHRSLFALYRLWRDTTGADLANANAHLTDSIAWWIHATVPTRDRVAPIGDQSRVSEPVLYDYHRHTMLEARRMTNDATARANASWWLHAISQAQMESGFNFRHDLLPSGDAGAPPDRLVYHATGTGQLFARTGWDEGATWLQFSAGPYVESHAHQDQGSFTLFRRDWLAVTENIWTHSGIQQGTDVHNLLRFERDGALVPQRIGTTSSMIVTPGAGGAVHVEADLTPAYDGDPAVQSWRRTLDFAGGTLVVRDRYALGANTQAVFQLNVPVQPTIDGATARTGDLRVRVLSPPDATLSALDWTTRSGPDETFRRGWRLDIAGGTGEYVVELEAGDGIFADGFD